MASRESSAPPSLGLRLQFEFLFTLPDVSDIALRDYQETMQRPFFSLSKNKRVKPIHYTSPDGKVTVEVQPNQAYGMATIWDADVLIFLASYINDRRQTRANDLSQTIKIQPADLLKRIGWGTGGKAYERLTQALDRLQSTTIKTNIRAENRRESVFSWIESYTHLVNDAANKTLGMEITLSKWFFDGLQEKNLLSISSDYFRITSGLAKWLYRAARKHAGGNGAKGFTIGIDTLHAKSGSESKYSAFKTAITHLATANDLPDIHLEMVTGSGGRPQLWMVMRDELNKAKKAADAALASPAPAPVPPASAPAQTPAVMSEVLAHKPKKPTPAAERSQANCPVPISGALASLLGSIESKLEPEQPAKSENTTKTKNRHRRARKERGRISADSVIEPHIMAEIRREFPGWDYDVLLKAFDDFLDSNPDELPPNYSRRFKGFVALHDKREGHVLGRYQR